MVGRPSASATLSKVFCTLTNTHIAGLPTLSTVLLLLPTARMLYRVSTLFALLSLRMSASAVCGLLLHHQSPLLILSAVWVELLEWSVAVQELQELLCIPCAGVEVMFNSWVPEFCYCPYCIFGIVSIKGSNWSSVERCARGAVTQARRYHCLPLF